MRRIILLVIFFFAAPVALIFNLIYLSYLSYNSHGGNILSNSNMKSTAYAALPSAENSFSGQILQGDIRTDTLKDFLSFYKSPLLPYAQNVVDAADKYRMDFRLVPAIAMQESNLCKKAPKNSNNCWGFGIYGKKVTTFDNYAQAIDTVTKTLAMDYKNKGLTTPEQIMSKYTPSNNGAWADSVTHFMEELKF